MLAQWKRLAADAKRDQLRTQQNKVAGSNTRSNFAAGEALRAISGHVPGMGILRAAAGRAVDSTVGRMNDMKTQAFLNPGEALRLIQGSRSTPDYIESLVAELRRIGKTAPDAGKRAVLVQAIQQQNAER